MKTIIDAVNELKGHFNNNYLLEVNDTVELECSDGYHSFKTRFNTEVTSLSHFAGEELFKEYLAADKALLKVDDELNHTTEWLKASAKKALDKSTAEVAKEIRKEKQVDYTLSELSEIDGAFSGGKKYLCTTGSDLSGTFNQGVTYTTNRDGLVNNYDDGSETSFCNTGCTSKFRLVDSLKSVNPAIDYTSEEFWKDAPEWADKIGTKDGVMGYWMDDVSYQLRLHGKNSRVFFSNYDSSNKSQFISIAPRPQPKPVKPVWTNEMRDNDILPDIGVDCLLSKTRTSGNGYPGYIAGENAGELVYITSHFETRKGLKMASYFGVNKRFGGVACAIAFEEIDTRTDKEKAIDDIRVKCGFNKINSMEVDLLSKAYDEWVTFKGEE
tara:strand:+ start:10514 stop:11662 length:1149 start_codon:yes stop_codon:yes gene_type:complete